MLVLGHDDMTFERYYDIGFGIFVFGCAYAHLVYRDNVECCHVLGIGAFN